MLAKKLLCDRALTGGCTGSSETTCVEMAGHCWKSHVVAHLYIFLSDHLKSQIEHHRMSMAMQGMFFIWEMVFNNIQSGHAFIDHITVNFEIFTNSIKRHICHIKLVHDLFTLVNDRMHLPLGQTSCK